jgi:two-component system sensor histidine kinase VicK
MIYSMSFDRTNPVTHRTFISGSSEMSALVRQKDWKETSVGAIESWPESLRTIVNMTLENKFAMALCWGKDHLQFYNETFCAILGNKHPSALGRPASEVYAESWHLIEPLFARVMAGEAVSFENLLVPLNRKGYLEDCYFTFSYSPVRNSDGSVAGILITVMETSEKLKTEREAEKNRQQLISEKTELFGLLMQAPAAIAIVTGPEFTFVLANTPYQKLVGKTSEQLMGRPLKAVFPELTSDLEKILNDVVETGNTFEANEFSIFLDWTDSGQITERFLNFIYAPYRNADGKVVGLMTFVYDVTVQVLERRKAVASATQLRLIADRLPALISYMDNDKRYQFVNEAYTKWFKKPRDQIEGKTRKELINNDQTYEFTRPYEDRAFAGEAVSFELTLTKPDGSFVNLDTEYLPDRSPETGAVRGIIGVGHDITQRKKALEEMEQLTLKLKEAVNSRDEFMSIASHELKTPITSLKLQLQLTQRRLNTTSSELPSPEKISSVIETCMRQVDRLTDLIEGLLNIARIQAGRLEYNFSEFNLRSLLDDVADHFSHELEVAGSTLQIKAPESVLVHWDRFRIEQVLVNLISNAIKYAPAKPIDVQVEVKNGNVHLSIKDAGPGIPKERQGKIFERFERATASRNISGLGLGLFIVKQVVAGHQGSIGVESIEGTGTKFFLDIPAIPTPEKSLS